MSRQTLPFGLWPSPVSPLMDGRRIRLEDVQWAGDGQTLVWLERRSGRSLLVVKPPDSARYELDEGFQPDGGLSYGGGDFTVRGDLILFADRSGQLVRRRIGADLPEPITPAVGRAASPCLSADGRQAVYCWTDGTIDGLALADVSGQDWPVRLRSSTGFFMQPAWQQSIGRLAWIEWDAECMPWDETRLMLARQGNAEFLEEVTPLVAGPGVVACQPLFSPDGNWLSHIESNGEWEDLVLTHLPDLQRRVLVHGQGFHLCEPAWVQGMRTYGWSADNRRIYFIQYANSRASLWVVEVESGLLRQVDTAPYTWLRQLAVAPVGEQLAFLAESPAVPPRIIRLAEGRMHVEARSLPEALGPEWFAGPRSFNWSAPDGTTVHGLYFPPTHPQVCGESLPPAILSIHGGPNSEEPVCYNPEALYFTSRGYAFVEVNYRGSSGYGRSYLRALYGRWGEVDVEDAAGAARALVEQGLADPARIVIMGGSAGGYTVLNALIHYPELFKAGVARYPVGNLFTADQDTHKFEANYTSLLVGKLPATAEKYQAWSPALHLDQLNRPLAIFQGADDRVVPPSQAEEIVTALRRKGIPHLYKLYPGEGHGFRKTETIVDYYESTEQFLQQHVLFAP